MEHNTCSKFVPDRRKFPGISAVAGACALAGDGVTYRRDGALAIDSGAAAEEPGVRPMADHLKQRYPDIPVHAIPGACIYRLVTA